MKTACKLVSDPNAGGNATQDYWGIQQFLLSLRFDNARVPCRSSVESGSLTVSKLCEGLGPSML
jgi:hypothetical protein